MPNDLKGVVHAVAGHFSEHLLNGLLEIPRTDAVGGSQLLGPSKLVLVDMNSNDAGSCSRLAAHDNREANSSDAEDSAGGSLFLPEQHGAL